MIFFFFNNLKFFSALLIFSSELLGVQISFRRFFYQNWAFIVKERNPMFYSKYNFSHLRQPHHMFLQAIDAPQLHISSN